VDDLFLPEVEDSDDSIEENGVAGSVAAVAFDVEDLWWCLCFSWLGVEKVL
jgi:hypothetical protein